MKRIFGVVLALLVAACTQDAGTDDDETGGGWGTGNRSSSSAGLRSSSASSGVLPGSSAAGGSSNAAATSSAPSVDTPPSSAGSSDSGAFTPAYVFGHSSTRLYRLDADTLQVTDLGLFRFRTTAGTITFDEMTDIAVNNAGHMYGCSFDTLYDVNLNTMEAHAVASLTGSFNGLTFYPAGTLDPMEEVLVGAINSGDALYRINLSTGATTPVGSYGGGWVSSGDIVSIDGDFTYATVKRGTGGDHLAVVDPVTGVATVRAAAVGTNKLWGLGYWNGVLYGFAEGGQIVTINRDTGVGSVLETQNVAFWGAGVTTAAKLPN